MVRISLQMGKKMEPHESSSDERAGHLSEKKRYEVREMTGRYREPDRNGRIEMSFAATACNRSKHTGHHCECPAACNHHPSGAFCLRAFQQHVRDDSIAQQNQYECSHEFAKAFRKHDPSLHLPIVNPVSVDQAAQSNERVTARFHKAYSSSRFPFLRFGCHVRSTAQFARRSFRSLK